MFFRLKSRRNLFKQFLSLISFVLFRWHQRIHFYLFFIVLFVASLISYRQPFGLLFHFKYLILKHSSVVTFRNHLINQHKQDQKIAYEWLENLSKNPNDYPNLISNRTHQSRFYDYLQITNNLSSSYKLLTQPKQIPLNTTDQIVISILYSRHDTDHQEGKFYIGQVLYHLLKNYHSRFLITLCENNNTNDNISDDIELIRRLVPVFIVNSISNSVINSYEREKQAHLQCILANFQSFPNINYLLLLQDDAEPVRKDFYNQFSSLIDSRIKQQWPLDSHRQQPAFIKIHHPRWLIGYIHPSFYMIVQLFATSLLLTFVLFACFYLYQTIVQKNSKLHTNNINQFRWGKYLIPNNIYLSRLITNNAHILYFIFYFLLITLVLILLNHSNVSWTWRSLHPSFYAIYPSPSCCLPGVLYFRKTYLQIIDYLTRIHCDKKYAIDTAFDDLPKYTNLQTYLVEPNLVHHIGLYSRLRQMYINPYLLD